MNGPTQAKPSRTGCVQRLAIGPSRPSAAIVTRKKRQSAAYRGHGEAACTRIAPCERCLQRTPVAAARRERNEKREKGSGEKQQQHAGSWVASRVLCATIAQHRRYICQRRRQCKSTQGIPPGFSSARRSSCS